MARKRRETGWQPLPAPDLEHERLMADMAPLLTGVQGDVTATEAAMVPFMKMVLDSDALIQEPEFDGAYDHPAACVQAFAAAIEEQGFKDVDPDGLSAADQSEPYLGLMEDMTIEVLAPELREAILSALQDLRQRAREEGNAELISQAATVYAFLDGQAADEVWAQAGVVQSVVHRSLDAGIEICDASEQAAQRVATGGALRGLLPRLSGASPEDAIDAMDDVLAKHPGLADFLKGEVETQWQQGARALASGALDLGLFSEAEISAAFAEARTLGLALTAEGNMLVTGAGSYEDKVQAFASWLSGCIDDLAIPPRLAHMQARLDELSKTASPSDLAFLLLPNEELEEADNQDRVRPLLERALVAEMLTAVQDQEEADG